MAIFDRLKSLISGRGDTAATVEAVAAGVDKAHDGDRAGNNPPLRAEAPAPDEVATRAQAMQLIDSGNAIENAGRPDEALPLYEAAIALRPDLCRGYINRGNILIGKGRVEEAIAAYVEGLARDPASAGGHYNLGNAWLLAGKPDSAIEEYRIALAINPAFADAEVALGNVFEDLGRFDDAIAAYRRALVLQPGYAEVHNNLGIVLVQQARIPEAIASIRRALAINPDYAGARNNLGNALKAGDDLPGALAEYQRALALDPGFADALSGMIFARNYQAGDRALALDDARRYGKLVARSARPYREWRTPADPDRPLRVGFVSGDLREHPVGHFLEGALAALHDEARGQVSLHAYSNHRRSDETTGRLKASFDRWTLVAGMDDAAFARQVHADAIDILIDLSGHTGHHRLPAFAWKPAPVQATWLGYFGTTGVEAIDYLIADPIALPPAIEGDFTETIWRLPETRLCFTPPRERLQVAVLPALAAGHLTFGNFGHLTKINDDVLALWARVLAAIPDSRLRLKAPQLLDEAACRRMRERFANHGVAAGRLDLVGPSSRSDYLAAYGEVDVMLDSFPYPGGTTTAEALWMGVPVLSLAGDRFLSRQGNSLLGNAGLGDWVAADADAFVARAVAASRDLPGLARLRADLRTRVKASPLFDAPRFARHLHEALRGIWREWCRRQA